MEIAPYLDEDERDGYDPRVDVIYSNKAWLGRQQCKYAVNKFLEVIGEDCVFFQCDVDGYESFINALESEDMNGHIAELISPSTCTDLCSMPD